MRCMLGMGVVLSSKLRGFVFSPDIRSLFSVCLVLRLKAVDALIDSDG